MNTARIRPSDAMLGAWGLALLGCLFLDWYTRPEGGVTGWAAFSVLDKLLALVALLALATPVVTAARDTPAWPVAMDVVTTAVSLLVGFFVVYRLLDQPGPDAEVAVDAGGWIGSFALLGIFISAALAMRDERAPAIPEPSDIPVMPAPSREAAGSSPGERS